MPVTIEQLKKGVIALEAERQKLLEKTKELKNRDQLIEAQTREKYLSYVIKKIDSIFHYKDKSDFPKALETLLSEVWHISENTGLSYTACPCSEANKLFYSVVEYIIDSERPKVKEEERLNEAIKKLMPGISEHINLGGNLDPISLQNIFKKHIYNQRTNTLISLESVIQGIKELPSHLNKINIKNIYADTLSEDNEDLDLTFSDISQAFLHSYKMQELKECKESYDIDILVNISGNLTAHLNKLCNFLRNNSIKALGSTAEKKEAGEGIYAGLPKYLSFYTDLSDTIKKKFPAKIKEELEILINQASDPQARKDSTDNFRFDSRFALAISAEKLKTAINSNLTALADISYRVIQEKTALSRKKLVQQADTLLREMSSNTYIGEECYLDNYQQIESGIEIENTFAQQDKYSFHHLLSILKKTSSATTTEDLKRYLRQYDQLSDNQAKKLLLTRDGVIKCSGFIELCNKLSAEALAWLMTNSPIATCLSQHLEEYAFQKLDSVINLFMQLPLDKYQKLVPYFEKIIRKNLEDGRDLNSVISNTATFINTVSSKCSYEDKKGLITKSLCRAFPIFDAIKKNNLYPSFIELLIKIKSDFQKNALIQLFFSTYFDYLPTLGKNVIDDFGELLSYIPESEKALLKNFIDVDKALSQEDSQRSRFIKTLSDISSVVDAIHSNLINKKTDKIAFDFLSAISASLPSYFDKVTSEEIINFLFTISALTRYEVDDSIFNNIFNIIASHDLSHFICTKEDFWEMYLCLYKDSHKALFIKSLNIAFLKNDVLSDTSKNNKDIFFILRTLNEDKANVTPSLLHLAGQYYALEEQLKRDVEFARQLQEEQIREFNNQMQAQRDAAARWEQRALDDHAVDEQNNNEGLANYAELENHSIVPPQIEQQARSLTRMQTLEQQRLNTIADSKDTNDADENETFEINKEINNALNNYKEGRLKNAKGYFFIFKLVYTNPQRKEHLQILKDIKTAQEKKVKLGALITIKQKIDQENNIFESEMKKLVESIINKHQGQNKTEECLEAYRCYIGNRVRLRRSV